MPGSRDKGQQINNNIDAVFPPWLANTRPTTIPAFGPGQEQMLAKQLAQGGFGTPTANMGWLNQIYSPATTYTDGPLPKLPVGPPPKPTDKPKTPTKRTNFYSR